MFTTILLTLCLVVVQSTIDPATIPKFQTNITISGPIYKQKTTIPANTLILNPLAMNDVLASNPSYLSAYTVATKQIMQQVLPSGFPQTKVYAYGGDCYDSITGASLGTVHSWPGPTFLVQRYGKVQITWVNGLSGKHMFAIEKNLHYNKTGINFDSFIPNVAHVHGMANPSNADGIPQAWFNYDGLQGGDYYTSANPGLKSQSTVPVANLQEEGTLIYHDHAMGMTRLNFYAGLAGFLIIADPKTVLSKSFDSKHDILLSIADRTFNTDGSFYYPSTGPAAEFPNWNPQFFGDVMTVNGKAYPNMNVEKNRYRVRVLNSCNSRIITIGFFVEETASMMSFTLYKSDSNYHYQPIVLSSLELPPAGRAEIVLDFTKVKTKRVILKNIAPAGSPPSSVDDVMSFTPNINVATPIKPPIPGVLNANLTIFPFSSTKLVNKYYTLYELTNSAGNSIGVLINGVHMGVEDDVFALAKDYDLYFINLTPDTHPMHMHLVNFQCYKEAPINVTKYNTDWQAKNGGPPPYNKAVQVMDPSPYLTAAWTNLGGVHRVWRDMVNVRAGIVRVLRIRFKYNNGNNYPFDATLGRYVLHCHIVEHEDNDMMRYFSLI